MPVPTLGGLGEGVGGVWGGMERTELQPSGGSVCGGRGGALYKVVIDSTHGGKSETYNQTLHQHFIVQFYNKIYI